MKTPHAHGRTGRNSKARREPAPLPFKVFVGYADALAARRAMWTIGDAVRASGRHVEICPMLWRFAQLESSHWRDRAITAAIEADVVVLANSTPGDVSPGIEQWVNDYLAANRGRKATLVSVSGASDAWTISIEQTAKVPAAHPASIPIAPATSEELVA